VAAEATVLRQCWLAVGRWCRVFRLNSGVAWVGNGPPERQADGSVVLRGARPITLGFGLPDGKPLAGPSDLVGWTEVEITPKMVGLRIPVFTGIETKRTDGGKRRDAQVNFAQQVSRAGGIAGFANSPAVAQSLVRDWASRVGAKLVETLPTSGDAHSPKMRKGDYTP
jgi:hypothetical protein